ncbi:type IX secretion system outer membrane channel protein PorV [Aureivirga sp. CE67]|uniref:type IX secretion system outer membrane channel protein PorV n=1 Tax=Aureivirga sp. CE67 TaxID=1788983 RepID=UPI0018CAF0B8|nr:type IX secretion system outer membrane channel protein PorV [Aureivirga sp. CE67]
MKKILLFTALSILGGKLFSQEIDTNKEPNPITTAAPFLLITPDARAGGMGDVGATTSADAQSQFHNPAKYAFLKDQFAVGVNYTPWLRELTDDIFVGAIAFGNRINERSAWSAGLRYFNLGEIQLTDNIGAPQGTSKMNELALSGAYALKLSEKYSMGVELKYVRSDLGVQLTQGNEIKAVNTFTVGVSGYYQSDEMHLGDFNGRIRGGFNISDIGPKVSYVDGGQESFMPANLKLGAGFDFILDSYNTIGISLEANKLLVPTPDPADPTKYDDTGFFEGIIKSFGDAPGGFSEELKEITYGVAAEYSYDELFLLRAGYFHENELKGARQFFTTGLGFKFKSTNLDLSYLVNAGDVANPLENTLRFSIAFNFGNSYED